MSEHHGEIAEIEIYGDGSLPTEICLYGLAVWSEDRTERARSSVAVVY